MSKKLNFRQKCFSLLCKKEKKKWEVTNKSDLSEEMLYTIQKKEWIFFWKRIGEPIPSFYNKIVVDYGCGFGFDSLLVLQNGAQKVYCLEISKKRLKHSEKLHQNYGFRNTSYLNNNDVTELSHKIGRETVDTIICRDVMEHVPTPYHVLDSMYSILKPGGVAYIGFSPLYKSPYGPHFRSKCNIPWVHLIFSEQTILTVFKEFYGLSASVNKYQDIEGSGVNKLSYFHYLEMLKSFDWTIEINHMNEFAGRTFLKRSLNLIIKLVPFKAVKELFIVTSYVKVKKYKKSQ